MQLNRTALNSACAVKRFDRDFLKKIGGEGVSPQRTAALPERKTEVFEGAHATCI
jgi:hypothetical protein